MRRGAALAFWLPVSAATALCAGLLLPYLGDRVMHRDEALAIMVARRPLGELLETVQLVRGGAPLHFLLVALVERMGGGLTAARLLSAIAACVAVVAIALLGRALFGPIEGVVAAAGLAACPVALYYGEFARMYALFVAVTTLALWCLVRALEVGGRWWAGAAAAARRERLRPPLRRRRRHRGRRRDARLACSAATSASAGARRS